MYTQVVQHARRFGLMNMQQRRAQCAHECAHLQGEAVVAWLEGLGASEATLAAFRKRSLRQPIDVAIAEANRRVLIETLHMSSRQARCSAGSLARAVHALVWMFVSD